MLFDGTSADAFEDGKLTEEGLLDVGALTKLARRRFPTPPRISSALHALCRGQGAPTVASISSVATKSRSSTPSDCEPVFNGCAALYRQQIPNLNMSFPPLAWQTYDIFFTAARWDEAGKKTADARITVYHNGVAVHDELCRSRPRPVLAKRSPGTRPILLQDHGNPVRFRNVWLVLTRNRPPGPQRTMAAIDR